MIHGVEGRANEQGLPQRAPHTSHDGGHGTLLICIPKVCLQGKTPPHLELLRVSNPLGPSPIWGKWCPPVCGARAPAGILKISRQPCGGHLFHVVLTRCHVLSWSGKQQLGNKWPALWQEHWAGQLELKEATTAEVFPRLSSAAERGDLSIMDPNFTEGPHLKVRACIFTDRQLTKCCYKKVFCKVEQRRSLRRAWTRILPGAVSSSSHWSTHWALSTAAVPQNNIITLSNKSWTGTKRSGFSFGICSKGHNQGNYRNTHYESPDSVCLFWKSWLISCAIRLTNNDWSVSTHWLTLLMTTNRSNSNTRQLFVMERSMHVWSFSNAVHFWSKRTQHLCLYDSWLAEIRLTNCFTRRSAA